ncbi:MAG: 3-deoxy-8-phosphooctulonate synthase [Deltaproteobacteria bacterium]|nr:MAG: 3-deoxy-8-phosphooctulonate synthase [Deltaproteobacteria bacterium]
MGPRIALGPHPCGEGAPLLVIAGPCVVEGREITLRIASALRRIAERHGVPLVFKASFDKANRTSGTSFRGIGMAEALAVLEEVRRQEGLALLTDIHLPEQAAVAAEVVDVLQIPAFLCRQTDLIEAAAATGRAVNIKKGQFMAPEDMAHSVEKARAAGARDVLLTERGTTFGYHNLVVDMRGLAVMRRLGVPVCFDATHSVQRPSAAGGTTGGDRREAPLLARAAAAVGIDALFAEVHEDPDRALSDGPNSLTYELFDRMLDEVVRIRRALAAAEEEAARPPTDSRLGDGGAPAETVGSATRGPVRPEEEG